MVKTTPTFGRLAVMAVFTLGCFGLLLYLWNAFGGSVPLRPKGYRIAVPMQEVSGLAEVADVRISGVPVGKVVGKRRDGNRTLIELEMQPPYAPVRHDARVTLRRKTLLGEGYIELTPGSSSAPFVREGGQLPASNVLPSVELDEVFSTFDDETRALTRAWLRDWAAGVDGRGQDLSDTLGHLPQAVGSAGDVLSVLRSQRAATRALVRDSARAFGVLSREDARVQELITSGAEVFATTASREADLRETVRGLPPFLRDLRGALLEAERLAAPLRPAVRDLRPAARALPSTLRRAAALSPDLEAVTSGVKSLSAIAPARLRDARALVSAVRVTTPHLHALGRQLAPIAAFLDLYKAEAQNSWPKVGAAVQAKLPSPNTGRLVHYLRAVAYFGNEFLVLAERRQPYSRPNAYAAPRALDEYAKTGIARAFDCSHLSNPTTVPPINAAETPPCLEQEPATFQGRTTRYPRPEEGK